LLAALASLSVVLLLGCSAGDIRINPPDDDDDTATVEVTVTDATTDAAVGVEAVVIVGGVRATVAAGEEVVTVTKVPFGTNTPPQQPLTVTADGYVTHFEDLTLNATGKTQVAIALEAADPALTGTIEGTATNLDGGAGVANALLVFTPDIPGDPPGVKGATDTDGRYIIGGIPTGQTVVEVTAQGFLPAEETVVVVQGSANADLDLALTATSTKVIVRGTVTNLLTRAPIAGASVTIGGVGPETTGADGRFELQQVPVGDQTAEVTAADFDPLSRTVSILPTMADLQFQLAPTESGPPGRPSTISGAVTIRNRPDSAGATVKAIGATSGQVIDADTTNADGEYGLFVPPGQYRIEASFQAVVVSRMVTLPGGGRRLTDVDFQITAP
jgi:hypothetical protein